MPFLRFNHSQTANKQVELARPPLSDLDLDQIALSCDLFSCGSGESGVSIVEVQ
jgi:hypothetical protein